MISTHLSRASAVVLLLGGLALLFAADVILPSLSPGYPPAAAWLGQLLGAAWLGVAALNWLTRATVLGGIYGRPVVLTNAVLYFISATILLKAATRAEGSAAMWVSCAAAVVFAAAYGWLLFRGPFERDRNEHR